MAGRRRRRRDSQQPATPLDRSESGDLVPIPVVVRADLGGGPSGHVWLGKTLVVIVDSGLDDAAARAEVKQIVALHQQKQKTILPLAGLAALAGMAARSARHAAKHLVPHSTPATIGGFGLAAGGAAVAVVAVASVPVPPDARQAVEHPPSSVRSVEGEPPVPVGPASPLHASESAPPPSSAPSATWGGGSPYPLSTPAPAPAPSGVPTLTPSAPVSPPASPPASARPSALPQLAPAPSRAPLGKVGARARQAEGQTAAGGTAVRCVVTQVLRGGHLVDVKVCLSR